MLDIILIFTISIIIGLYLSKKSAQKHKEAERLREETAERVRQQFKEELKKPKTYLRVDMVNGSSFYTAPFEPEEFPYGCVMMSPGVRPSSRVAEYFTENDEPIKNGDELIPRSAVLRYTKLSTRGTIEV